MFIIINMNNKKTIFKFSKKYYGDVYSEKQWKCYQLTTKVRRLSEMDSRILCKQKGCNNETWPPIDFLTLTQDFISILFIMSYKFCSQPLFRIHSVQALLHTFHIKIPRNVDVCQRIWKRDGFIEEFRSNWPFYARKPV